jgi:hypothetical protein
MASKLVATIFPLIKAIFWPLIKTPLFFRIFYYFSLTPIFSGETRYFHS